jgi:hypothetical protein
MSNELLLDFRLPGDLVRLPSRGFFYDEGVLAPDVVDGEVNVFPMSAYDEIYMKNISDIINGTSLSKVFAKCIPQILKPDELFSKDVDFLLLVLRKVTYGNNYTLEYTHTCEDAARHEYTIQLTKLISATRFIDPTSVGELSTIPMDNGQIVILHPIKFKDYLDMMKNAGDYESMSNSELQIKILESTLNIIHSVDGITDKNKILEWTKLIPVTWYEKIANALSASGEWGVVTSCEVTCLDCKEKILLELPLNPMTFFLDS